MNEQMNAENTVRKIVSSDKHVMSLLHHVRSASLPYGLIVGGCVRDLVWNTLDKRTPLRENDDVDVAFYDPDQPSKENDLAIEQMLRKFVPGENWSVKNQARMHIVNLEQPYASIEDAINHFPETATAFGVSIDSQCKLNIVAPWGLDDVVNFVVRPTPDFAGRELRIALRVIEKKWLQKWPRLRIDPTIMWHIDRLRYG